MIDNTVLRDEKRGPPFMHTALVVSLELWKARKVCEFPLC